MLKKPLLFGEHEDAKDPKDVWYEEVDESGHVYYYNPARGQSSWVNDVQAAISLQRWMRSLRHRDIGKTSVSLLVKAMKFHMEIEENFSNIADVDVPKIEITSVDTVVHFALHLHFLKHKVRPFF